MPETHYLNHYCTEAPEPLNVYPGIATLDEQGEAWIQLPDCFSEINRDPSYHLTPIGAPMPNLHIADKAQNNRWVERSGFEAEIEKLPHHRGKYIHPELYDLPKEHGIHYRPEPAKPVAIPND